MKNKIIVALRKELKEAEKKERREEKLLESAPRELTITAEYKKAVGYTNGILEAIDIVSRIGDDE